MCLAIPGKILTISNELDDLFRTGRVSFDGVVKEINLVMVPEAKIGDFVMVHVGSAISIVDEEEAHQTMEVLRQLGENCDLILDEDGD